MQVAVVGDFCPRFRHEKSRPLQAGFLRFSGLCRPYVG
jgi:hypothetical protein